MITTLNFDQHAIIRDIIELHIPEGALECDVTYSKGNFYKEGTGIEKPRHKFDLFPQTPDTIKASADALPVPDNSFSSLMFDPPFVAGHTKPTPTGIIGTRFHGFPYMADVWKFYSDSIKEFARVIKKGGVLVVKCQDTVSSGKQYMSHVHIINECEANGFYCKDLFILQAKSRLIGHNHAKQKHARKFHSYFLVFIKQ